MYVLILLRGTRKLLGRTSTMGSFACSANREPHRFRVNPKPSVSPRADFGEANSHRIDAIPCVTKFLARWKILCRSISTLAAVEISRRSTFTRSMGSSSAPTLPIRETIAGEVLPLPAVDQAVEYTWDLDYAMNASAQASGVFQIIPIPTNIDPKGDYAVRTDFRPPQSPPPAIPTAPLPPVDVPEDVAILLVLGDTNIYHRSPEDPPVPFLEGEDDDEVESDEDQAGGSTPPELPKSRARTVTAGNVASLGLADEGFKFAPVLEFHVPAGPAKK